LLSAELMRGISDVEETQGVRPLSAIHPIVATCDLAPHVAFAKSR